MSKVTKESIRRINDIFTQGDSRYFDASEASLVASFLDNKGIDIEETNIELFDDYTKAELGRIRGPQKIYKIAAKKFLEERGYNVTGFEAAFRGGIVDVLAEKPATGEIVAVECCSCRISKAIDYLEYRNTILWIVSLGDGVSRKLPLYVIRRGTNWDRCISIHNDFMKKTLEKVKSPLDRL